jgi:hypothetical protein
MEKNINKILQDIYELDASFREHEDKLREIIKELIASRPDTKFTEEFARELRAEVMRRAEVLKTEAAINKPGFFSQFTWVNKLAYALGGAAIALVLATPVINLFYGTEKTATPEKLALDVSSGIAQVKERAWGSLSQGDEATLNEAAPKGIGGGGGGMASAPAPVQTDAGTMEARAIMPEFFNYEYQYVGEELNLDQTERAVFKHNKDNLDRSSLANLLKSMDFSLVDLGQFKNAAISNLSINEDRDFGLALNINMTKGNINIFKNWQKWPQVNAGCTDQACYERNRLKISDIPKDERLISLANNFVKDYGIDIKSYGEPFVYDHWRHQYEVAEDKAQVWIPDEVTVIYPLLIDGETVYDQGGNPTGLSVSIDIRNNRAAGAHNITVQTYQRSVYETETDAAKVIAVAEQGGRHHVFEPEVPDAKIITIELDTPALGLMRHWQYNTDKQETSELYIPALIFPVKSVSEASQYFNRENIVVPLVKEILEEYAQDNPDGPMPRPMPLLEKAPSVDAVEIMDSDEGAEEIDD